MLNRNMSNFHLNALYEMFCANLYHTLFKCMLCNVSLCQNVAIQRVEGAADELHVNIVSVRLSCSESLRNVLLPNCEASNSL